MKLVVGKTYIQRRGKEVKIMRKCASTYYPFVGDDLEVYKEDGSYVSYEIEHQRDLVDEKAI